MADDPAYLTVGTEVSAKYKGAFCEAKIRKVVRVVKCKVTFKAGNGSALLTDDQIKGSLRIGANVEAKHPDKNQFLEATINKIQDCSQYTVVFDDGDITTLRRSALCLKSGRHFNESETLDQLPLTHPEHFSNPVVGGRRGVRRRVANTDADKDESSEEEDEDVPAKKDGKRKYERELDMGKVVCVELADKKKSKDSWFPALVVSPAAQETVKIRIKDEYLVRSFRDGRYYTVPKKEITEFTSSTSSKYDSISNTLRSSVDKALLYLEKNELPPHWDREVLFGSVRHSESGDEPQSESEISEDDPREEKDRFIAQLYKFMDDRSTPLNKVPVICNKDLDLHKLFKTVTAKGGYTKVTNTSQWKAITIKLGFSNMPSTSTINLVKQAYKKFLFNFEEFYRKLGCTWTPRTATTSSKSRSSRSLFRERITPSSSRESVRDLKRDDGSEETLSRREAKDKSMSEEKEKTASPEAESPAQDTGNSSESEVKKSEVEEPRRSRGRQSKKQVEEASSPSPSTSVKRKRHPNTSKERDSSVASSKDDEGGSAPPTPTPSSTNLPASAKKVGRGKYKRQSTKSGDAEEKEVKEERSSAPPVEPVVVKSIDIRLNDKLNVYYPKSEGKTYEAKVIDINDKNETFLVHYTGWNNRYDEWIDRARVSENVTLQRGGSGDSESSGKGSNSASGAPGTRSKESAKRKGRNSSSVTSNSSSTAASATPQSTSTTGTRSKSATGKRKRSTSSEVPIMAVTPKRRRTRQKSGQDTSTAPTVSESEPETSDSDGKSSKSEKANGAGATAGPVTPSQDTLPSNTESVEPSNTSTTTDTKPLPSVKTLVESKPEKKPDLEDADDEVSSSSVTSTKSKEINIPQPAAPTKLEDSKESSSSSTGSNQVIDLNQIRSEMKGLDKMVKSSTGSTATPQTASSPAPPPLAAVESSPTPPEPTKLDIYEFKDDASDDAATSSAPKLKMFSPRSPDKGPNSISAPTPTPPANEVVTKKEETIAPPTPTEKVDKEKPEKVSKVETLSSSDSPKTAPLLAPVVVESAKDLLKSKQASLTPLKLMVPLVPIVTPIVSTSVPKAPSPVVTQQSTPPPPPPLVLASTVSQVTTAPVITTVASHAAAPSLVAVTNVTSASVISTVKTKPTISMPPRMPSPVQNVPRAQTPIPVTTVVASHPPPPTLIPSSAPLSVITSTSQSVVPISAAAIVPSQSLTVSCPPPVLLQRPQLQPALTPVRPVITISAAATGPTPIPERPILQPAVTPMTTPTIVANVNTKDAKVLSFMPRKPEVFSIQPSQDLSQVGTAIPTISIIAKESNETQQIHVQPPPPPIKVATTIPPPPLPVTKTPIKSSPSFSPSTGTENPQPAKPKKKKLKIVGSTSTTPVKPLAPLPTGGAPPPPPVVVPTTTQVTTTLNTPTPGRKTPVKKRIPPPIDSPGKPLRNPALGIKPGKMNPEAMNAAIANVGASPPVVTLTAIPPAPTAVPTTVITSTPNIFQSHPNTPTVLFTTSTPPQSVQALKTSQAITIKSSAESIAASIAAVASMGSSQKSIPTLPTEKKLVIPMKRFMKDTSTDKGIPKDRIFPVSSLQPPPQSVQPQQPLQHQPPPPPIVIGKPMESTHSSQPPPPSQAPITIQAKFQHTGPHSITGTSIQGPAVTFVKTSAGHHILDQSQVQSNLSKHPVIIIPAAPVVIKQAPFQHHPTSQSIQQQHLHHPVQHTTIQPVIVSKPVQMEAVPQPSVLVTAAPSIVKPTMLPITVTPSVVSNVPVSMSMAMQQHHQHPPVSTVTIIPDPKPTTAELPPTITVTKATTVMKSVSPDIVAVSSYSSTKSSSGGFTPVKQEQPIVQITKLEERKESEIIVKPAPASAQIVFQTESKSRNELIQIMPKHVNVATASVIAKTTATTEEESCNSLLCEEIIPGSPTTGEESEKLEEDALDEKKDEKAEVVLDPIVPMAGTTKQKPVIVVGPKFEDEEDGFMLGLMDDRNRRNKFGDDDDDKMEDRSVDSPMGPPSEGRTPFRDSFSDGEGGDHSPPSSPSTTSTISTDSSRQHDPNRLSPTPEGGSSKSKDSDDDDVDSDVGSKSTHLDDGDSKHGSTRGSTRIRNQSSRLGRSPSPPLSKRRRIMRRNKSPEEVSRYTQRNRTSSGRKITPVGSMSETKEVKATPPPPPVNLAKPPKTGRFNFIPNLSGISDPEQRIAMISEAINNLKDQYHRTKTESASFDRRVKRWKRRVREKERLARQEATRATS